MRQVLIEAAHHSQRLLEIGLTHLADRGDLVAVLVVDRILAMDLEEFRLLVHHKDWLVEDRTATRHSTGQPSLFADLTLYLRGTLIACWDVGSAATVDRFGSTVHDTIGPSGAVPIALLVFARGVWIPVGCRLLTHMIEGTWLRTSTRRPRR